MNSNLIIYEYRDYLKDRYGEPLYRIPIDAGGNCPHRGKEKSGGCIFCPDDGARAIQLLEINDVQEQVHAGVHFARKRYKANRFMAYLQTFTNTYCSIQQLHDLVKQILEVQEFDAITFGTRPDCITFEVIKYLRELQQQLDVWVELGIQSCHNKTLERINRGHCWQDGEKAIYRLHDAGISIGAHIILGLPGETREDYLQTIKNLTTLPIDAIKLHNLHVIEGTVLAEQFQQNHFPVFNEREYCEILLELLPYVPEQLPIMRLTTDTEQSKLIAPKWNMSKGQFRKFLFTQMRSRGIAQGCALRSRNLNSPENRENSSPAPVKTEDGSVTFYNLELKEHYHTLAGARSEAEQKYNNPANIDSLLAGRKVMLLDVCFGLGYNSLVACDRAIRLGAELEITGLEINPRVVQAAAEIMSEENTSFDWKVCLESIVQKGCWKEDGCSIEILWGDARYTAAQLQDRNSQFDLVWLDAFSTQKNSELWTIDFFQALHALLRKTGMLLTYSAAIPVRSGLIKAGFIVGETRPFGRERGGTVASADAANIAIKLPKQDLALIESSRGIPYRDPDGTRTNKEILRAREFEIIQYKQEQAQKHSTPNFS